MKFRPTEYSQSLNSSLCAGRLVALQQCSKLDAEAEIMIRSFEKCHFPRLKSQFNYHLELLKDDVYNA